MSETRRAIIFSYASQYGNMVLGLITTMIVSRLLVPEEVGIYSLAATIIVIVQTLRDFGTGQYIIQEKNLDDDALRAAFSGALIISWTLAALCVLAAPWAGEFYEEEGVTMVMYVMTINLILLPFGTITSAYLRRQMNFKPEMINQLLSGVGIAVVTISCAYAGMSYMSMAWGTVTGIVINVAVMAWYRPKHLPWKPGTRGLKKVFSFGVKVSLIDVLREIANHVPNLVLGKSVGFHGVGIYSRATSAEIMFQEVVSQGLAAVITPLFAKKYRQGEDLHEPYMRSISHIAILAWPFFGTLAIMAEEITLTLFGENWLEVAPLLQIGAIGGAVLQLTAFGDRVLVATQRIDTYTKYNSFLLILRIVVVGGAAFHSLYAVIIAATTMPFIRMIVMYKTLRELTGTTWGHYAQIVGTAGFAAALTMLGAWLGMTASAMFISELAVIKLLMGSLLGGLFWIAINFVTDHPLLRELAAFARIPYPQRKGSN